MDRHPAAPTFGRKEQALARATPRNAVASQRHPRLGIRAPGTTRLWETLELKGISGSESPDPVVGGFSSEPVHSTTPPPGTRFSVSRARLVLRRRIGDAAPARCSRALWASFPSGALGPHSCFSSVRWGMQTGPTGTDGISKVSPLLPPQSPTRRDMVETEQIGANASVSAESRGCRPQAPRVCAARLCRPPLSGARTGMVTGGVRRTACTRRPRALRRASFPVICGGRTAFPLRLLPRPSSHSQMMCLTFSEFSSADAQERDRDKSG